MAARRMLPTRFFKDPDIMDLSSKETQLILVGLILTADDEGRELAHARLLGRELDEVPERIERALQELADHDLLILYTAGKHRYYQLTRWREWQTLSKPTPSRYPAPPVQEAPTLPQNPLGIRGRSWETRPEEEEEKEEESEQKQKRREQEEASLPARVVNFPAPRGSSAVSSGSPQTLDEGTPMATQVAQILGLPLTPALCRVVEDYHGDAALSLLGEADAAREWIHNPRRNHKEQSMTPTFFRRWLQRECEHRQGSVTRQISDSSGGAASHLRLHSPTHDASSQETMTRKQAAEAYVARLEREMRETWEQQQRVGGASCSHG